MSSPSVAIHPGLIASFPKSPLSPPSEPEHRFLTLLSQGLTGEQIARKMGKASRWAIHSMAHRTRRKYGVDTNTQLLNLARKEGWLL